MADRPDPLIEDVARRLRRPLDLGPAVDARVLSELRRPAPARPAPARVWAWLRRPRTITVSPLQLGGVLAATIALVIAAATIRPGALSPDGTAALSSYRPTEVRFTLAMPGSSRVALVGDFNDWNPDATPLAPAGPSAWTVTIPLRPGRYRYTFVVDGSRWVADPAGAAAPDDFGQPTSVITVIPN